MANLRATFLLKIVLLLVAVALFLLAVWVVFSAEVLFIPGLIFLAVFWFVGLEVGLLIHFLEKWAAGYAARCGRPINPLWFVDRDAEKKREYERFEKQFRDNPTPK